MEKLTDRARRIFLSTNSPSASSAHNGQPAYQNLAAGYPTAQPPPDQLPESFSNVHHHLVRYAEQIKFTTAPNPYHLHHQTTNLLPYPLPVSSETDPRAVGESWMPDIYQYASAGVGVEERYTCAQAQPTPFIPSSPRVDQNDTFNFDHGALMVDLEETSYMAWF